MTPQREIYQIHYKRIYNTCLRIIGNRMDAEEAMHDVFLKLFDKMDELKDEKSFYSWSRTIAIRTAIDRVRKKKPVFEKMNFSIVQDILDDEVEIDDEPMELSVEVIKNQLNCLPDGYRIVLSMRLFEACTFEEIAEALQIKEPTVRSQYVRGRQKLCKMLKNNYK